jgi:hypothetical protein
MDTARTIVLPPADGPFDLVPNWNQQHPRHDWGVVVIVSVTDPRTTPVTLGPVQACAGVVCLHCDHEWHPELEEMACPGEPWGDRP